MVDIRKIIRGMQLIFYETNVLLLLDKEGERPGEVEGKQDKIAFLGKVFSVDPQKNEVTLRIRDELRAFSPNELWLLPDKAEKTEENTPPSAIAEKLMGIIISLAEGKVGPPALQEIANELKKRGGKPIAPQELLEVL